MLIVVQLLNVFSTFDATHEYLLPWHKSSPLDSLLSQVNPIYNSWKSYLVYIFKLSSILMPLKYTSTIIKLRVLKNVGVKSFFNYVTLCLRVSVTLWSAYLRQSDASEPLSESKWRFGAPISKWRFEVSISACIVYQFQRRVTPSYKRELYSYGVPVK